MKATFVELPPFQRLRDQYFDDDSFEDFQNELMANPEAGSGIKSTGGLRKVRFGDESRGKGKRVGLRVIYFWKMSDHQFWLFTVYGKDEADDLTAAQRKALHARLIREIQARSTPA
jgi:hypothetical protein